MVDNIFYFQAEELIEAYMLEDNDALYDDGMIFALFLEYRNGAPVQHMW